MNVDVAIARLLDKAHRLAGGRIRPSVVTALLAGSRWDLQILAAEGAPIVGQAIKVAAFELLATENRNGETS